MRVMIIGMTMILHQITIEDMTKNIDLFGFVKVINWRKAKDKKKSKCHWSADYASIIEIDLIDQRPSYQ